MKRTLTIALFVVALASNAFAKEKDGTILDVFKTSQGNFTVHSTHERDGWLHQWIVTPKRKTLELFPIGWPTGEQIDGGRATDTFVDLYTAPSGEVYLITQNRVWRWHAKSGLFSINLMENVTGYVEHGKPNAGAYVMMEPNGGSNFTGILYYDKTTKEWVVAPIPINEEEGVGYTIKGYTIKKTRNGPQFLIKKYDHKVEYLVTFVVKDGQLVQENEKFVKDHDTDKDDVWDRWDNCPGVPNPPPYDFVGAEQEDWDNDGRGDACDDCPVEGSWPQCNFCASEFTGYWPLRVRFY